jgi:hypothetical protein
MASNEESEHKFGGLVLLGPYKACNISQTQKQPLHVCFWSLLWLLHLRVTVMYTEAFTI